MLPLLCSSEVSRLDFCFFSWKIEAHDFAVLHAIVNFPQKAIQILMGAFHDEMEGTYRERIPESRPRELLHNSLMLYISPPTEHTT